MIATVPVTYAVFLPFIHDGELDMTWWLIPLFFTAYTLVMIWVMQRITLFLFFFPGQGVAREEQMVRAKLKESVAWMKDVEIREKDRCLSFIYHYADGFVENGVTRYRFKQMFTVSVKFNADRHECIVTDTLIQRKNIAPGWWGFGLWNFYIHRGVSFSFQYEKMIGFDVLRQRLIPESYRWNTDELQNAVIATLIKNGWSVRFSLF